MRQMKIAIIIPTIGRKSLEKVLLGIENCLDFKVIKPEILVIFDGKNTYNFRTEVPGVQIIETGQKVYAGGARNLGIDKSKGNILVFLGDNGVPDKNWLKRIVEFHRKNKHESAVCLGNITWKKATDFTRFLENGPQFDFKNITKHGASWRHFYTSNISIKRSFLGKERFASEFSGWGFEDIELGYRLSQKGMRLIFDKTVTVFRLDTPTIETVINKTELSVKNVLIFEKLHPAINIYPKGLRYWLLYFLVWISGPFTHFSKKVYWWRLWKKAWLTYKKI